MVVQGGSVPPVRSVFRAQPEATRHANEIGERPCMHLVHHLSPMNLHRFLGGPQNVGDLFVQHAGDDQAHHLALPGCQRLETVTVSLQFLAFGAPGTFAVEGLIDRIEQRLVVERLGQHLHARLQMAVADDGVFGVTGDEQDFEAGAELAGAAFCGQVARLNGRTLVEIDAPAMIEQTGCRVEDEAP